jgi:hypothetical protein
MMSVECLYGLLSYRICRMHGQLSHQLGGVTDGRCETGLWSRSQSVLTQQAGRAATP